MSAWCHIFSEMEKSAVVGSNRAEEQDAQESEWPSQDTCCTASEYVAVL
jgi:hypothetical protein